MHVCCTCCQLLRNHCANRLPPVLVYCQAQHPPLQHRQWRAVRTCECMPAVLGPYEYACLCSRMWPHYRPRFDICRGLLCLLGVVSAHASSTVHMRHRRPLAEAGAAGRGCLLFAQSHSCTCRRQEASTQLLVHCCRVQGAAERARSGPALVASLHCAALAIARPMHKEDHKLSALRCCCDSCIVVVAVVMMCSLLACNWAVKEVS